MNVLLISANREVFPDPVFPLGAAYVAKAAIDAGHTVVPLDLLDCASPEKTAAKTFLETLPDVVALSLRNLDNAAWPLTKNYLPDYRSLVSTLKALATPRGVPVIVGGSAFSLMPDLMLDALGADLGISGEGEESFPRLLNALSRKQPFFDIPGIVYRPAPGQPPIVVPPAPSMDGPFAMGGRPWPERDLFGSRKYLRRGGMANIQTKRGCVFRCKYCTYPLLEGTSFRLRPPEDVASEMEFLSQRDNIRSFFIVDSIFNTPPEHAEAICEALIRKKLSIRWSCYATPAGLTFSLLEKMKAAGCDGIELGTDSGENNMLLSLGKSFSLAHMLEVGLWCHKLRIGLCHSLIFGGPGETRHSVHETIKSVEATRPTAVIAMAGIRVYPDTPLASIAESEGVVRRREDYLSPVFYLSKEVAPFLQEDLSRFAKSHGHWVLPGITPSIRPITQRILRFAGYRRPLWHLLRYAPFGDLIYRDR